MDSRWTTVVRQTIGRSDRVGRHRLATDVAVREELVEQASPLAGAGASQAGTLVLRDNRFSVVPNGQRVEHGQPDPA
jgi:hypothetical protein